MDNTEKHSDKNKNDSQQKAVMVTENTNAEKRRTVKISLGKTALFREGEEPDGDMPTVAVSFAKDDIEQLKRGIKFRSRSRLLNPIKSSIIRWCARAAGGLSEAEFYCTGMELELDEEGTIKRGRTFFRRRYSCGVW